MQKRLKWMIPGILSVSMILNGCMFEGEQSLEEMDPPPEDVEMIDDLENTEDQTDEQGDRTSEPVSNTTERTLYLIDQNGFVVPQILQLPAAESKEVARQSLEYLVIGGPVSNLLPNGFQAVLPAGTEVNGLNLQEDGTLIVDVSEEFTNYRPEDELKILQAMTFTLTQFDSIERIKLRINGKDQEVMPVNGTPISEGFSRDQGINVFAGDVYDLLDSKAVTLYYPAQHDNEYYYVPVTIPIQTKENDMYEAVVQALMDGPSAELPLLNVFRENVQLTEDPEFTDGILTLTFNESIFSQPENQVISDEVMTSLVLSLTELPGIEAVQVQVEGHEQVFQESGEELSEPVTREKMQQIGSI
ncbi:germination protein M [Melghiribacillus thermohalophilus]|uniref:Germination protein M n=1 Tax=Melghiribacillus thermohalophilus TaxID=1324956 RepID=A0A4R3ND43_9BACI|nr:GerMN domain-containing protein [Melghiribacillus thermohalophilus]TCT25069.1 germination protein M [Melghiribacillus thermohalophilus]